MCVLGLFITCFACETQSKTLKAKFLPSACFCGEEEKICRDKAFIAAVKRLEGDDGIGGALCGGAEGWAVLVTSSSCSCKTALMIPTSVWYHPMKSNLDDFPRPGSHLLVMCPFR